MLKARGVSVASHFICIGRPGLNRKRGSLISFGKNVTLCNTGIANPLSEGARCRLATLSPDAELVLADRVGLSSVVICAASKVEIGEGTIVGGGAMIIDTDFHHRNPDGSWGTDPKSVSRAVYIGKNCFIGARAVILKGVTVGDRAIVGAGAVVRRNVEADTVVSGNPATVVKRGGKVMDLPAKQ